MTATPTRHCTCLERGRTPDIVLTVPRAPAWLHLDGWGGRSKEAVVVVGETPTRYRITPAGRYRWLHSGQTVLVPKYAITFDGDAPGVASCRRCGGERDITVSLTGDAERAAGGGT